LNAYLKAKEEIKSLNYFINLIDDYEVKSLKNFVIKEYAIHNSMIKVVSEFNKKKYLHNFQMQSLTTSQVKEIILSKPNDELHSLIRRKYNIKTRPQRKRR